MENQEQLDLPELSEVFHDLMDEFGKTEADLIVIPPEPEILTEAEEDIDEDEIERIQRPFKTAMKGKFEIHMLDDDEDSDCEDTDSNEETIFEDFDNSGSEEDSNSDEEFTSDDSESDFDLETKKNPASEESGSKILPENKRLKIDTTINNEEISKLIENLKKKFINLIPIEIFQLFFDNEIINLIIEETNLYARQNGRDFQLTKEDFNIFLGFLLYNGIIGLEKYFWSSSIIMPEILKLLTKEKFLNIIENLHFADNQKLDKNDKFYKIRPFINLLNQKFQQFGLLHKHLTIGDQVIPFKGQQPPLVIMEKRRKSIRVGYMAWTLASSKGYIYTFDMYSGKSQSKESKNDFGIYGNSIINLLNKIDLKKNILYFKNSYTTVPLMLYLKNSNYMACGEIKERRRKHIEKDLKTVQQLFTSKRKNGSISSISTSNDIISNNDKSSSEQEYIPYLHGIDMADRLLKYRIKLFGRKWWWPIFVHYLDVSLNNAWIFWKIIHSNEKKSLLKFREEIIRKLMNIPEKCDTESEDDNDSERTSNSSVYEESEGETRKM